MSKKILATLMLLAVMASGLTAAPLAPLPAEVAITIAHTNDMHARGLETKTEIGYSRIAGYVAALKAKNPNVLLLDAGDAFHGLPWVNLEAGAPAVKLMNATGYVAMAPGNHDFNYGFDRLKELEKMAQFKILAANVYKAGSRVFEPYMIKDVGGVRVAIFGLATPETVYKSDPAGIKGLVFENPVAEAYRLVNFELDGQYDVLVCVAHLGIDQSSTFTSWKLAESVPQIDVIIDGHSHSSLASVVAGNTTKVLVAQADSSGTSIGVVDLVVGKDRKVAKKDAHTVTLKTDPALPSDAAVKKMADDINAAQTPMLSEQVATTAIALEGKREIVRTSQSNLGSLIANGMLATTGADIALMNGGGIRDSIPAGPITKKHVYTVMPFGNYIWTAPVKGSELDAILENGVGKLPAADGRYPHLAGWSFTLDASKPAGDRVSDIMVKGAPVDPAKTYTLATLNFLFAGGDEYKMLVGKSYKEFPMDADSFMAYVKKLGSVTEESIPYKK